MIPTRRILAIGAGAAGLVLASAGAASAHISINPSEVPTGGSSVLDFIVGHGCDGSATTAIAIQIPEGVTSVRPTVVPGWSIDIETETLAEPFEDSHGNQVTERTSVVTYAATADPLPDAFRQVFPVSMRMPAEGAGEDLAIPVVQSCVDGEAAWISVPSEGEAEPEYPAPVVALVASSGDDHGHGHGTDEGTDDSTDDGADDGTENGAENGADGGSDNGAVADGNDDDGDDGGSNALAATALVVGGLGLGAGGLALVRGRR